MTIIFGLLSALSYGYADFVGALASKRVRALTVTTVAFSFGLVLALFFSLFLGASYSLSVIQIGVLAGFCSAAAISFLYAALALGPISITSPMTAVLSAIVPVVIDIAAGEELGFVSLLAIVLILIAVVLVAFVPGPDVRLPSLRATIYSVGAGLGFGGLFVFIDAAPSDSGLGVIVVMRIVGISILLLGLVLLFLSKKSKVVIEKEVFAASTIWLVLLAGFGDITGNVFFVIATREGALAVAAVLTALYPVGTIVLARIILKEKLAISQNFGILLAVAACGMLALS